MTEQDKKQKRLDYARNWAKRNPEKVRAAKRRYYESHKGELMRKKYLARIEVRAKTKAAKLAWEEANPEIVSMRRARRRIRRMNSALNAQMKMHYGITADAFHAAMTAQGGVCAICGELRLTNRVKRLVVDHDHSTGALRGLLCHRCNCGLGYFSDNLNNLGRAIAYLEAFNAAGDRDWIERIRFVLARLPETGGKGGRSQGMASAQSIRGVDSKDSKGPGMAEPPRAMAA